MGASFTCGRDAMPDLMRYICSRCFVSTTAPGKLCCVGPFFLSGVRTLFVRSWLHRAPGSAKRARVLLTQYPCDEDLRMPLFPHPQTHFQFCVSVRALGIRPGVDESGSGTGSPSCHRGEPGDDAARETSLMPSEVRQGVAHPCPTKRRDESGNWATDCRRQGHPVALAVNCKGVVGKAVLRRGPTEDGLVDGAPERCHRQRGP